MSTNQSKSEQTKVEDAVEQRKDEKSHPPDSHQKVHQDPLSQLQEEMKGILAEKEAIHAEKEMIIKEKEDIFTRLQRALADYQNLKKQNEAEKMEWVRFANGKLLLDLIEVLDNLERAVHSVPESILQSEWYKGFVLAKTSLDTLIKKEGLERMNCVQKPFDPTLHEAILYQESPDVQPEHILSEVKAGKRTARKTQ